MGQARASKTQQEVGLPDDRILPETRWLAAFIIPTLIVAVVILYGWPNDTDRLFAWPMKPSMTPMVLGAAYMAGIYYFTRVVLADRWHPIKIGILPVAGVSLLLGIATILHWDRFNHGHPVFFAWAGLYFVLPFLVFGVWLRNRNTDPRLPDADELNLPRSVRLLIGGVGGITCACCLLLYLLPNIIITVWPWILTPLTARVVGALFALPGLVGLGIALDQRWSAARIVLEAQALSLLMILIAALRARNDFDWLTWSSWLVIGGLCTLLIFTVGLYISMEVQRRRPLNRPSQTL